MKQIFYINWLKKGIAILGTVFFFSSCQKEVVVDGGTDPGTGTTNQKPKVGTVWTYQYYVYNPPSAGGGVHTSEILKFKAKSEDVLGGEKWLNIVNMTTDTTVFLLNEKTGGLYQYANNSSNLFCKDPAAVGDTYTSFNDKSIEDFTVKGVKDSLPVGSLGNILTNFYEGVKVGRLIDQIWYNSNAWMVRRTFYLVINASPAPIYYRYSSLFLSTIDY